SWIRRAPRRSGGGRWTCSGRGSRRSATRCCARRTRSATRGFRSRSWNGTWPRARRGATARRGCSTWRRGAGAAATLTRALSEGADPTTVLAEVRIALSPRNSDGELALLEAHAEALSALSSSELEGTARVWRELGAARWDLADDPEGAFAAWERGAALDGEHGLERLARDLVAFGGHADAARRLEGIATRK